MKVTHSPLELIFNDQMDYELVMNHAIDYVYFQTRRQTQQELESLDQSLFVANALMSHVPSVAGGNSVKEPFKLHDSEAHLVVRVIDAFVEGTIESSDPRERELAEYGKQVLELVRSDLGD